MSGRRTRIEAALRAAFAPSALDVADESARHAGHAGARPEGETHFAVRMTSAAFAAQSRVARSRAVHAVLQREFESGLHALSLHLNAPADEAASQ